MLREVEIVAGSLAAEAVAVLLLPKVLPVPLNDVRFFGGSCTNKQKHEKRTEYRDGEKSVNTKDNYIQYSLLPVSSN